MKIVEVVAAIIRDGNRILATQRGKGDLAGGWEFPGGKIEQGETHEAALIREIQEELEVEIVVEELVDKVEYDYSNFHLTMYCYYAKVINGQIRLTEHLAAKWLTKDTINSVKWLPADIDLIEKLKNSEGDGDFYG